MATIHILIVNNNVINISSIRNIINKDTDDNDNNKNNDNVLLYFFFNYNDV